MFSSHSRHLVASFLFLLSYPAFAQAPADSLAALAEELRGTWNPDKGLFAKTSSPGPKTPVTPEKIAAILKHPEVKSLMFNGVGIDLPTAQAIRDHGQHLQSITISHCNVGSAEFLGTFAEMKQLTDLMVGSSDFGDDGLAILATMPNLKKLQLVHVSRNPELPITAKGLNALADGVPGLEFFSVNLHRMEPEMITALAKLKQLQTLEIEWASPAFLARVREVLPNTQVRARGGRCVRDGFDAATFDAAKDLTDEQGQPLKGSPKSDKEVKPEASPAAGVVPPIFPFWQKRFKDDDAWLEKAGYTPLHWTKPAIDLTQEAPFSNGKLEQWMRANPGGVAMLHFKEVATEADEDRALPELRRLAGIAEETKVTMVVYPYFGCHIDTAERAMAFLQKLDCPNIGLTFHMPQELRNGNGPKFNEMIHAVKDKIQLVVVCGAETPGPGDNPAEWGWDRLMKPLDEGDFDWAAAVKTIRETGYEGPYAFICWQFPRETKEYLSASMAVWKTKLQ